MIADALEYPTRREDAVQQILIGGALMLIGITSFLALGYHLRVVEQVIAGDDEESPAFEDWEDLAIKGLVALVVSFVYLLPILLVGIAIAVTGVLIGTGDGLLLAFVLGSVVVGGLWLVVSYALPAALANYVRTDEIAAAFAVSELSTVVLHRSYAMAWLKATAVGIVLGFASLLLVFIPLVNLVTVPFIGFYANVVAYRLFAEGYRDALGIGDEEPTDPAARHGRATQPTGATR